jgi:hypothetical protein
MTVSKRPRDKETNPSTPPRVKRVYKAKEKVVEQPFEVPSIPTSKEEKKHVVDKTACTQTQLDNQSKRKKNAREYR